jgi:hypothetical protein
MTDPNLQSELLRKRTLKRKIIGGGAGALVVIAAIAGITAVNMNTAAEEAKASASRSAEARRVEITQSAEASRQASLAQAKAELDRSTQKLLAGLQADAQEQKAMEAEGWTYVSDHLYYSMAPKGSVYCGSMACAQLSVVSQNPDGCPGGIYLEASFLTTDNVSVGRDSEYTAALKQGQQAAFKLYDRSGAGKLIDVTSMRCS